VGEQAFNLEAERLIVAACLGEVRRTVGAVPPVSNMNPAGALRMIVPVPALPLAFSV